MRKLLFISAGLLTLGCLIIPVVFSQSANEPTPTPKVLTSDEFKQQVAQLNAAVQGKLDAAIAKLIGSSQSAGAPAEESAPPAPKSAPEPVDTGASENNSPAPSTTPSGSGGLNMYQQ